MYNFSKTINLSDGTQYNLYDVKRDFSKLLQEKLGYEAAWMFRKILEDASRVQPRGK